MAPQPGPHSQAERELEFLFPLASLPAGAPVPENILKAPRSSAETMLFSLKK